MYYLEISGHKHLRFGIGRRLVTFSWSDCIGGVQRVAWIVLFVHKYYFNTLLPACVHTYLEQLRSRGPFRNDTVQSLRRFNIQSVPRARTVSL